MGAWYIIYTMRIIAKKTIKDFWQKHPQAEQQLKAWYADTKQSNWQSPADIKAVYANASIVANNRVVFNIKGNDFRLVCSIHYPSGIVFVRFVGTHAEYDKIDVTTI